MAKRSEPGPGSDHVETAAGLKEVVNDISWTAGALAGAIATIAMGLVMVVTDVATLQLAIAALYAQEGFLAGWTAHVAHGTLFGLIFAAFFADPTLESIPQSYWRSGIAGLVYGTILAVVGAGLIMPMWLNAMGFASPPSIPNVTVPALLWHFVYGTVLGVLYPALLNR